MTPLTRAARLRTLGSPFPRSSWYLSPLNSRGADGRELFHAAGIIYIALIRLKLLAIGETRMGCERLSTALGDRTRHFVLECHAAQRVAQAFNQLRSSPFVDRAEESGAKIT